MKTAVSVPDDVFQRADHFARQTGRSRSEVYSAALREYVARHAPDELTEAMDRAVGALGEAATADDFVRAAANRRIEQADW